MKSEMANKLEELLAKMSQKQFEQEWSEIESLGLGGPTIDEILAKHDVFKGTDKAKLISILLNEPKD